jgi:hypothetical protein
MVQAARPTGYKENTKHAIILLCLKSQKKSLQNKWYFVSWGSPVGSKPMQKIKTVCYASF